MSRKNEHKKEMEEFRRKQRLQQQENAAATAGGALKNTSGTGTVTVYNTPAGITPFGLNPGLRIENSILDETKKQQEYSGFADTFAQKAMNEELLGNYPDSRYLWGQAAEMDKKSKDAGAKAEFFREVVRNPAALFAAPNSAPKPAKPSVPASRSNTTAPSAEIETLPPWQDYLEKSARQVVLGNYTDDVTLAGTAGQIGLGLLGLDLPADLRDLFYDLTHLKSTPWHQTALDAFALLPVVGGLKYADDAIALAKYGDEALAAAKAAKQASMTTEPLSDAINAQRKAELMDAIKEQIRKADATPTPRQVLDPDWYKQYNEVRAKFDAGAKAAANLSAAAKHADNLMDTGADLVYNGAKQFSKVDLMPSNLMDELAASGKKYTPQDVVMVTKNANGDLLWLEQGHKGKDGLIHILEDHKFDFKAQEYPPEEIPSLLNKILSTEPVRVRPKNGGMEAIYNYEGHNYTIGYGTNGYIVSFYPSKAGK